MFDKCTKMFSLYRMLLYDYNSTDTKTKQEDHFFLMDREVSSNITNIFLSFLLHYNLK